METETIEKTETVAEQRKAKAVEGLQKLETERASITTRARETEKVLQRLDEDIVTAERAGTDPENLENLVAMRKSRLEQQQIPEDLARMLPVIERDLFLARAEVRAADVAREAELYNELVTKQRALTEVLIEAIMTATETIRVKEGIAKQQEKIQGGVRPYTELSPAGVRHAFLAEIIKRLESEDGPKNSFSLQGCDWSSREMSSQGDLLPMETLPRQ